MRTRWSTGGRGLLAARVGVAIWVALCLLIGALLLARHLLTLPTPAAGDPALRRAIALQRRPEQRDRWIALHVLYEDCGCSRRVLDHLRDGGRPTDVVERIVYITEHPDTAGATLAEFAARGFELDVVSPEQLVARYDLEAAPLLVVVDPHDQIRYLGGYTPRKQTAGIHDTGLIEATRLGLPLVPLPVFGCAVSRALRTTLDPLGIDTRK